MRRWELQLRVPIAIFTIRLAILADSCCCSAVRLCSRPFTTTRFTFLVCGTFSLFAGGDEIAAIITLGHRLVIPILHVVDLCLGDELVEKGVPLLV